MSAVVCGKRSFFDDIEPEASPSPAYKKYRCSASASPVGFVYSNSPPWQANPVDQLKALFPLMKTELLEKALAQSSNNVDLAIKNLQELTLEDSKPTLGSSEDENWTRVQEGAIPTGGSSTEGRQPQSRQEVDGVEWVDLLLKEITSASSIEDARSRAANVLEGFEKSVSSRASAMVAQAFIKENEVLKEEIDVLLRDNIILKRGIAIQHERQKEFDERNHEVQQLKQIVALCQEQSRILEMKNYALALHLRQAQQSSSIPGHFHPDVF